MNSSWPLAKLGDVMVHRKGFITIDDNQTYVRPRVQLHALGIVLRDRVSGAEIKTKKQQISKFGDFLVAEIDAKMGGFGIVPSHLDGAIVSSHYFLFEAQPEKLLREYLGYYCRIKDFRKQVEAQGSTNYAAIRPSDVLNYVMPLPTIGEQQRIVARIDTVQQQLQVADKLRASIDKDIASLLAVRFQETLKHAKWFPMSDVAPIVRRDVTLEHQSSYAELGIRSFGKGTFHKPSLSGLELGDKRIYRIEPGDLLFSNVFAWEGAIAVAQPEDAGRVGSHRFISCVPHDGLTAAEYLRYYFLTDEGMTKIRDASPGGAGRNRTLGLSKLMAIEVPIPTFEAQRLFVELKNGLEKSAAKRAEQNPLSGAVLPSILNSFLG